MKLKGQQYQANPTYPQWNESYNSKIHFQSIYTLEYKER